MEPAYFELTFSKGGSDCTSESEFSQPDVKKGEAKGLLEVGVQRVLPTHIGGLAGGCSVRDRGSMGKWKINRRFSFVRKS